MGTYRNQPTFDFLSGGEAPVPSQSIREPLRVSQAIRPDLGNEELRAQIHKLQYDVELLRQEREAVSLRHLDETRALQARADADFARAQTSEAARLTAVSRSQALSQDLEALQEQNVKDKQDTERRLRTAQETNSQLQEEVDELKSEVSSQERHSKHGLAELKAKNEELQQNFNDLRLDRDEKLSLLQRTQETLSERESTIGGLENEVLRLKALAGDASTLAVIKETLQEQVAHITKLEATTQKQQTELRHYKKQHKAIEIVEEEKRGLEAKVRMMYDMRKELSEVQLQRQMLEDERKSWTTYLEEVSATDEELKFNSPEELARAYTTERTEKASLLYELGKLKPDLTSKDSQIESLESQIAATTEEMEKLRLASTVKPVDNKAQARLERQRTLAVKEVEYLRAQLKMYDAEEGEFEPEKKDEAKSKRLQDLEDMVDRYRKEVQSLANELIAAEKERKSEGSSPQNLSPVKSLKRSHDGENDERLGELSRRNRSLQDELTKITTSRSVLEKELAAHKSQLSALKASSRTRVLELRSNPTADLAAVKQSTLTNLRAENEALLAQLEAPSTNGAEHDEDDDNLVPRATLTRLRADMTTKDTTIASRDKHILRLKQIFSAKSLEFREAVASILGWKLDFMPNGRVRATSMFNPGSSDTDTEDEGGGEEKFIMFDGEQGTMKVSGGPQSAFAREIGGLIEFWVDGRKEIPCFLAACTLEFWEKRTASEKTQD